MVLTAGCEAEITVTSSVPPDQAPTGAEPSSAEIATPVPTSRPGEERLDADAESPDANSLSMSSPSTAARSLASTTTSTTVGTPTTTLAAEESTITVATEAPATTVAPDNVTVVSVVIREGKTVSEGRVEVPLGNRIVMQFDADARLLVHIHGYDRELPVEPGVVTQYEFEGNLPGIFEVEDHMTHRLLVELQVSP